MSSKLLIFSNRRLKDSNAALFRDINSLVELLDLTRVFVRPDMRHRDVLYLRECVATSGFWATSQAAPEDCDKLGGSPNSPS